MVQQLAYLGLSLVLLITSSEFSTARLMSGLPTPATAVGTDGTAPAVQDGERYLTMSWTSASAADGVESLVVGDPKDPGSTSAKEVGSNETLESGAASSPAPVDEASRTVSGLGSGSERTGPPGPSKARKPVSTPSPTKAPTPRSTATPAPPSATPIPTPVATPAPPPAPPPPPPPGIGSYGSIAADSKANLQIGGLDGRRVAHRFRAGTSGPLVAIRFAQRGGAGYSAGNGGTVRISIRPDAGGVPSETVLASVDRAFGNPGGDWSTYYDTAFPSPPTLTAGQLYHVVFENVDAVGVNYISINELFVFNATVPRQPLFADGNYAVLTGSGGAWSLMPNYTATMDLTYANGYHDGMGYIESMWQQFGVVSGASQMVRERFTVSSGTRSVTSATVRVRRSSGGSPLIVTLEAANGAALATVAIPSGAIPVVSPDSPRNGSGAWVTAAFAAPLLLANGSTYSLRLSTAADTVYTVVPVREGTDSGFRSYRFTDGDGQRTTNGGGSWSNLYLWSPVDIQFYFR